MKTYRITTEFVDLGQHRVVVECSSAEEANAVKALIEIALMEEDAEAEQEHEKFWMSFASKHYRTE